jgi:hypothetical protein
LVLRGGKLTGDWRNPRSKELHDLYFYLVLR